MDANYRPIVGVNHGSAANLLTRPQRYTSTPPNHCHSKCRREHGRGGGVFRVGVWGCVCVGGFKRPLRSFRRDELHLNYCFYWQSWLPLRIFISLLLSWWKMVGELHALRRHSTTANLRSHSPHSCLNTTSGLSPPTATDVIWTGVGLHSPLFFHRLWPWVIWQ